LDCSIPSIFYLCDLLLLAMGSWVGFSCVLLGLFSSVTVWEYFRTISNPNPTTILRRRIFFLEPQVQGAPRTLYASILVALVFLLAWCLSPSSPSSANRTTENEARSYCIPCRLRLCIRPCFLWRYVLKDRFSYLDELGCSVRYFASLAKMKRP